MGRALGLLPVFRNVFILCAIRGFTIEKAAAVLRISPEAVTAGVFPVLTNIP
jgi:DNA-directed RNA polymerase specialized sigma24 family protein